MSYESTKRVRKGKLRKNARKSRLKEKVFWHICGTIRQKNLERGVSRRKPNAKKAIGCFEKGAPALKADRREKREKRTHVIKRV